MEGRYRESERGSGKTRKGALKISWPEIICRLQFQLNNCAQFDGHWRKETHNCAVPSLRIEAIKGYSPSPAVTPDRAECISQLPLRLFQSRRARDKERQREKERNVSQHFISFSPSQSMSFEMKLKFQCRRGLAKRNAERGVPIVGVCPSKTNTNNNNNSYESREFWVSALQVANREWRSAEIGERVTCCPTGYDFRLVYPVKWQAVYQLWLLYDHPFVQGMRQSWPTITQPP